MNRKIILRFALITAVTTSIVSCEAVQQAVKEAAPLVNSVVNQRGYHVPSWSHGNDLAKVLYVIQTVVRISEQQRAIAERNALNASRNERLRAEASAKGAKYYAVPVRRSGSNRGGLAKARVSDGKIVDDNLSVPKDGVSLSKGQVVNLGGDKAYVTSSLSQGDI
jgi:hypothetical protein